MSNSEKVENWFIPLSTTELTLQQAYTQLSEFGLKQDEVPLIIQLVENPKYDLPGIDLFHGSTNLETHDYIHILLGRGVLIKDEAFVLGFTMGSSNRVTTTEEKLFAFVTKYIYPKDYSFTDEDMEVFKDAVRLGFISDCKSLAKELEMIEMEKIDIKSNRGSISEMPILNVVKHGIRISRW